MAEGSPSGARTLFWGLACFLVLMVLVAWGNLGRWVAPGPADELPLSAMSAAQLAAPCGLALLPITALFLILLGIHRMRMSYPAVGPRVTWRVGTFYGTPLSLVGLLFLVYFVALALVLVDAAFGSATGRVSAMEIIAALIVSSIPIAAGWFLMLAAAEVLKPLASAGEARAMQFAVVFAFFFAVLLVAGHAVGTITAVGSGEQVLGPPFLPWIDVPTASGGVTALAVLTAVARRVARRYEGPDPKAIPTMTG